MTIMLDPRQSLASLVLEHPECASVFHRHRLDYCCHGHASIASASKKAGIDTPALLDELANVIAERDGARNGDMSALPTDRLIAHIVAKHHGYLRKALPFLQALAAKVSRVHGDHEPRLRELDLLVNDLADVLLAHLDVEERTLFPALMARQADRALVAGELTAMQAEHLAVADLLDRIRAKTDNLRLPEWACNSYRTLFSELEQLESDIYRHVHLENHVLLPRFVEEPKQRRTNASKIEAR